MTSPLLNLEKRSPLTIGHLQLASPFVQAALSGYSDWPMRTLARRHGASYTLAEVMLERFVNEVRGTGKTEHHLYVADADHPVGGQLMGADPLRFAPAALRLVQAGFDVIDINFGCPVRSAMGGCRGGYHLSQPEVALEIVDRVREAVPPGIPVTLKMRRGIDRSEISRDRFYRILDGAFERGVSAVTVHGRTVEQKYRGPSDWSFLKEVKQHVGGRTILGSGDLFTAQDCVQMLIQTGVDGVTIARGAIGNPWIFQQALAIWNGESHPAAPTVFEQRDVLLEHQSLAEQIYGPTRWFGTLRKFAFKYARLHPDFQNLRTRIGFVRTPSDWEELLQDHYAVDAPGRIPQPDDVAESQDNCSTDSSSETCSSEGR
ncbi:tRNA dihydrouridine synthase [Planctomicrobium sp. SH661]|uniref:tRNA dihydrouridine synthase n=1 Tax=Planctomicrobium sp. SH661 TaxID=3448124 RepID=UPI003F5C5CB3